MILLERWRVSVSDVFVFLLRKYLGVKLLGHRVSVCLPLSEMAKLFSEVVTPLDPSLIAVYMNFQLFTFLPLYFCSYSHKCEIDFHCVFNFIFLRLNDVEHFSCAYHPLWI